MHAVQDQRIHSPIVDSGPNNPENNGSCLRSMLRMAATVGSVMRPVMSHYTDKFLAGLFIGAGVIACATVGGGLPCIIFGVTYLLLSTALSISGLEQLDPKTVLLHILDTLCISAIGFGGAFLAFSAALSANLACICLSVVPIISDLGCEPTTLTRSLIRQFPFWLPAPSNSEALAILQVIKENFAKLTSNNGMVIGKNTFHLEPDGSDFISAIEFDIKKVQEWCLLRADNKYQFILVETAESLVKNSEHHPTTKREWRDGDIIRGEDVLKLFRTP